jgi:hypothetical protein
MLGVLSVCLFIFTVGASEPKAQTPSSATLSALIDQARKLALTQLPDIPAKNYAKATVSVYFASRTSGTPDGVMVSFPIRGSHRKEQLGEMEDRVVVIIHDAADRKPDVKKISRWLNEDSIALKEY